MDEIAICGVSARIAQCKNIKEFQTALLGGVDLITHGHDRWNCDYLNTPKSIGILSGLNDFDAGFFSINDKQADKLDPRTRQLLEVVFESILDAGYNPHDLRGSDTAIILAAAENTDAGLTDRSLAIMANTISYHLDLKGPSYALDSGCSSSVYALNQAVEALSFGSCSNAIVCSAQTHLLPTDSIQLNKLGVLSMDGKCKAFDDNRNGYVKSEGIVSVFLQKQNTARRIYATIAGIGCNVDGFKEAGMFNPSSSSQLALLQRIYTRFQLNPNDVEYVDAHGTGTLIGDIKECAALAEFFSTQDRPQPVKIGSVKTNAGHCENAAGLVSLVKLLVIINSGTIPANIHFRDPALDIPSIDNKILEVPQENTKYRGCLLSLNSFGIGGANGHLVLRPYLQTDDIIRDLPKVKIAVVAGRTKESVIKLLDSIDTHKENAAYLKLMEYIYNKLIKNFLYKGYILLNTSKREIQKTTTKKPIWFSYSGMGSQWPGMAKHLMSFQIFRDSIEKSSKVLEVHGINLLDIVINGDEDTFNDPEKCFPAIIAISVGMTDLLKGLGVYPDGIIGHSLGEIGCAYCDEVVTSEQAILMAHARGLATKKTKLIPGLMASVGLTIEECETILPDDIYIACHNYEKNITISGPKVSVEHFVEDLHQQGIFAKIVNTAGIAFHSKYIFNAGPFLLDLLKKIIPNAQKRTCRWLPSAIPESEYGSHLGQYNSAEYHYTNFMNRVHYKQVLDKVPENAVLIEVAPRGLFQAIFKRALKPSIVKLHLANMDAEENVDNLLTTIGKIYLTTNISLNLNVCNKTYVLPANGKTPFISPLVEWDHSSKWNIPKYVHNSHNGEKIVLNLRSFQFKFLYGHIIDGRPVFPSTGYLFLAWQAFANKNEKDINQCPVILEDVQIIKLVLLQDSLTFFVNILQSGDFEIIEHDAIVAKGRILWNGEDKTSEIIVNGENNYIDLKDIYKELSLRGYDYKETFRAIQSLDIHGCTGYISWLNNWIVFMESVVQAILFSNYSKLVIPNQFSRVEINPNKHQKLACDQKRSAKYYYNKTLSTASCGGITIHSLLVRRSKRKLSWQNPVLSQYNFIPNEINYKGEYNNHFEFSLFIALQIVTENISQTLKISSLGSDEDTSNLKETVLNLVHKRYIKTVKFSCVKSFCEVEENSNLMICLKQPNMSPQDFINCNRPKLFVFFKVQNLFLENLKENIVFRCSHEDLSYVLLKKCVNIPKEYNVITTNTQEFKWIEKVKHTLNKSNHITYLVSNTMTTGLIGFYNCLKEESVADNIRIYILNHSVTTDDFNPHSMVYQSQVKKDLTINIYEKDSWCTYRILPLKCESNKVIHNACLKFKDQSWQWVQSNSYASKNPVQVQYACLNHWDKVLSTEDIIEKNIYSRLASEFSGIDDTGKKVIGIFVTGCLKTFLEPTLYWTLPENTQYSLEEAATIPYDYAIAYIALHGKGNIKAEDQILITGTDSTSLAATFIALEKGVNVFIEVRNPNEQKEIKSIFNKNLNLHFVILNDKTCLVKEIMQKTNKRGINIIFTSNERNINKYYTEIVAKDCKLITVYQNNTKIDSYILDDLTLKQCQIYRLHLNTVLNQDNIVLKHLKSSIQHYLDTNALRLFKYVRGEIFNTTKNNVLEFLTDDSDDKMVINVRKEWLLNKHVKGRVYFNPKLCYLIVGGLGGVGLELTKWLLKRGATKIILNSKKPGVNGYATFLIQKWNQDGKTVLVNNYDATFLKEASKLLETANNIAPLGGIFNLAMVLNDKLFLDLTKKDFHEVVAPKLHICQHLDQLSQKMCPELKHFVVFSAATILGSYGQSNYGFANSAIEMLCKERKTRGLPALAIQWGCIGDVGFVARQNLGVNAFKESPQGIYSCLQTLEDLMLQDITVVSSAIYSNRIETVDHLTPKKCILSNIASILGVKNETDLNQYVSVIDLGIDSISILEIKNLISDNFGVDVPSREIRKMSLKQIQNLS